MRSWVEKRTRATAPAATLPARLQRIYILPTGAGLTFAATVLVIMAAALNHTNNLALFLSCLLASIGVVEAIHTHRVLAQITILGAHLTAVFCEETAPCTVHVRIPAKATFTLEVAVGSGPWTALQVRPGVAALSAPFPTARRGKVSWVEVGMATAAFLGLFRAWAWMRLPVHGMIYPKPWPGGCPRFPVHAATHDHEHSAQKTSAGEDPQGLRPYRAGDATTRIAWKAAARSLARQGPLLVQERRENHGKEVLLHWDACPGQYEERIQRLTACVVAAAAAGMRYGLRLPTSVIVPDHGEAQRHRCLEALALLPQQEAESQ